MIPCEYLDKLTSPETRRIVLPDAENHMIVYSFLWTQYWHVMDRQTDRNGLASTVLCIAGNVDAL